MYKFPNARLFVHELLSAQRLSGPEAIARGALHFGLISPDVLNVMLDESHPGLCKCMSTAKNIVQRHFDERSADKAKKVDAELVWADIEKHFHQSGAKVCEDKGCEQKCSSNCQPQSACQKHAPALLDVMLQQLIRYP